MRVTKIRYNLGATVQTKQFENVRPEVSLELELDENDSPVQAAEFLKAKTLEMLQELEAEMVAIWKGEHERKQVASPQPVSFGAPQAMPPQAAPYAPQPPHWSGAPAPQQPPPYTPQAIPAVDPKVW